MADFINSYRTDTAMSDNDMARFAPSIFAGEAHESRKESYGYIPTIDVLNELRKEGYEVRSVAQQLCRDIGRRAHTRHMVRMTHPDMPHDANGQHEIILLNSHDGTSSFRLASGYFRFVCANGLWIGQKDIDLRVYHRGKNIAREVIEGSFKVISDSREIAAHIDDLSAKRMEADKRFALAEHALRLRFGDNSPLTTEQALMVRREGDRGDSYWNTFNIIQENLMRGGLYGRSPKTGKLRKVRPIAGMDKSASFNANLWKALRVIESHTDNSTLKQALLEA